jgi:hypothetical protein
MPAEPKPRIWMYKSNNRPRPGQTSKGNWRSDFFGETGPGGGRWGGEWGINSKSSLSILRKEMKAGDLIIAYQSDTKEIVGLCRVRRVAVFDPEKGIEMDLVPACLFDEPVPIHALKRKLDQELNTVSALKPGFAGTLYRVSSEDAAIIGRHFPPEGKSLLARYGVPGGTAPPVQAPQRKQASKPDAAVNNPMTPPPGEANPGRREQLIARIIRATPVTEYVKRLHGDRCQVCGLRLDMPGGLYYSEGAHIRPLGEGHSGPDVPENVLCLCPNHHVQFDAGVFSVRNDYRLLGMPGSLRSAGGHRLAPKHLQHHRERFGFDGP